MALYFIAFVALLFFFPKFTLLVVIPALLLLFILGIFFRVHGLYSSVKALFSKKTPSKVGTTEGDATSAIKSKATPSQEAVKAFDDNSGFEDDEQYLARQRAMND